jgi:hypothetical protein
MAFFIAQLTGMSNTSKCVNLACYEKVGSPLCTARWVMKKAVPAVAFAWLPSFHAFFITLLGLPRPEAYSMLQ